MNESTERDRYPVVARRRKNWWILEAAVDGVDITTKVRRLDQASAAARTAIAQRLHVEDRSFGIDISVELPSELRDLLDRMRAHE